MGSTPEQRALEVLRQGRRFLVSCHRNPDGDALGAALGLARGLKSLGKEAQVYCPGPLPASLCFLREGDETFDGWGEGSYDATVVMDIASPALLPEPFPDRSVTGTLVVLDHHAVFHAFGDIEYRDPSASATGQIVAHLLRCLGMEDHDLATATALYTSLFADTLGFRTEATTADVLRLSATLLDAGVNPRQVAYSLFEGWPMARMELLRHTLNEMEWLYDGRVTVVTVSGDLLGRLGATDDLVDGLVDYGRRVRDVEVSALVSERVDSPGGPLKVSFRSQGAVDVAKLAAEFGGGGHRLASGANLEGPLSHAKDMVVKAIGEHLDISPRAE